MLTSLIQEPHRAWPARLLGAGLLATAGLAAASTVSVVQNGGFETAFCSPLITSGFTAAMVGTWAVGDPACRSGPINGITPLDGSYMLDFSPTGGISADVYQIVDVSAYAAEIDAGLVSVDWTAWFNSVARTGLGMSVFRYTARPTAFSGNGFTQLTARGFAFSVDGDRSNWEQFGFHDVQLTAGTRYLLAGLNSPTSAAQTYADRAVMLLNIADGQNVPEPGTLALVLAAALGLPLIRRR